tara:strand:- start:7308 stop:9218 length:1911 start_codon:yes stop_codon:yes gene_type:complete
MSGQYDIVFPARGRATFDGGKNNKFPRSVIADNESPDCLNVVFTNGAAETRAGSTKLNTTAIGSYAIDGIYTRHDYTGAETMVVFAGGSAWQLGVTTFTTIASAQSVFTAGVRVGCAEFENHLFIGNGYVTPYKYNGSAFTRHGVPTPASAVTRTVSATGGNLAADTYYYKVTYVNSQSVEGNVSAISTATTVVVSGSVNITGVPVAPQSHGVGSRYVYRANTTTAGSFKRIGTIADNTTTTFSDTISTGTVAAPTDNGEPPNYSFALYHQGRLFCNDQANPNYMWYSNALEPYTFASTNFQPMGDATFDLVRGAIVYANGIMVQCDNSHFLWDMPSTDPTTWTVVRIRGQYGSKSPFGAFLYDNKVMVPAMQNSKFCGFAAISGVQIDPESTYLDTTQAGSDLQSDRIEPDAFLVQEAYASLISSVVFKNKAYISLPYDSGATNNNRVYLFDFSISNLSKKQRSSWVPLTGIHAAQFCVYGGNLYYGVSDATGFVYRLEAASTYSDDGSAINSYLWTKEFSGNPGHENLEKDFRKVKLLIEKTGAYYMNLRFRTNSDSGIGSLKQVSLDPGATLWGALSWGVGSWGGGTDQEEVTVSLGQARGKRIQFQFSNQNAASQRFKIHGLNFTYNIKGKR